MTRSPAARGVAVSAEAGFPPAHRAAIPASLLDGIAASVGTPTYVYDARALDAGAARWVRAARDPRRVWYSVKANANLAVLRRLAGHGLGFEVATPGELARVRAAGVPPGRVLFGGVPKREEDVALALREGLDLVVLQAEHEVEAAIRLADTAAPAAVGLRVRPGIRAGAHPALETGAAKAKFGLPPERVASAWARLSTAPGLRPRALAVHLGSGVDGADPYERAAHLLLELAGEVEAAGAPVRELDLGGGLAVDYAGGPDPDPAELCRRLDGRLGGRAARFEPGRSIAGRMGLLLTRVLYRVERADGAALVCDAAFTDFSRTVLYGAWHEIGTVRDGRVPGPGRVDVLGATCESGDVLGRDRPLGAVRPGELLAVRDVGAYGFTMASNYNGRPRPAEVLVDGSNWRVVRPRESLEDLWRSEA